MYHQLLQFLCETCIAVSAHLFHKKQNKGWNISLDFPTKKKKKKMAWGVFMLVNARGHAEVG